MGKDGKIPDNQQYFWNKKQFSVINLNIEENATNILRHKTFW